MNLRSVYIPRVKLAQHEKNDLLADSHGILNRRKNQFRQMLNVCT